MKKFFYIIILSALFWLMPSTLFADGVVLGTVTLNGEAITAEYYIHGTTASLGSGHNACISQYSVGIVDVPASITVNNVTYPVTAVSDLAFRMCSRIKEVKFSAGVTRIGNFAFVGCQALTKVDLPSTVTTIGTGAFIDLPYLERIDIHTTTPPTWEYNDVFCFHPGGISDNNTYHTSETVLCVPEAALDIYPNTNFTNPEIGWTTPDGWGYFTNINIAADENAEEYAVYNGGTLTFFYDGNKDIREGTKYQLNTGEHFPGWTDPTSGSQPTSSPDPENHAEDITRVVFAPSFYNARPVSTCKWFIDCVNLDTIIGWEYLNTSEVKDMSFMFQGCTKLTTDDLDFSDFETSKVEGMMSMFRGCTGLTELDLDMFDTRKCENMGDMFKGCSNLFYINLSSFRTDHCEYFDGMFEDCSDLEELNIASFNMQRLVSIELMFKNCAKLKDLFIPVSINHASSAFSGCTSMENVYCYRFEPFDSWVDADIAFAPNKATMFHVLESTYNAWVTKYGEGGSYFTEANVTFVGDLGTDASPILLYSPADWTNLQNLLDRDVPVNAKMMNDIEVETMLGVGTDPNTNTLTIKPFTGLFDGNGYTLTVNYNIEDDYGIMSPAPFRFVTNAYIMNLHVNGTITASTTPQITQFPGGLVGRVLASLDDPSSLRTIISNCHVSTEIKGYFGGFGGIVGTVYEPTTIRGCLFDGKIKPHHDVYITENSYAALITMGAFNSDSLSVSDCMAIGFSDNGDVFKYYYCSALTEPYNNVVNSYVRNDSLPDTYFQNQVLKARSITSGTQGLGLDFGTIKENYYTSGITAYNTGLMVGETFYAGQGQDIPITLVAPGYDYNIRQIQPSNRIDDVDDTHIIAHVANEDMVITLPMTFTTIILHDSDDNYDNSIVLSNYEDNGEYYDVQFQGLTLNGRDKWNPLCLPFDLSETEVFNSPLRHAKLKVLDTITFNKKVLVYHFKDTTAITADKPYLIMLDEHQAIESPTFSHVTIKRSQPSGMKVELEGNPHKGFICIGNYEYIDYRYDSVPDNVTTFYLNNRDELKVAGSSTTIRAFDVRFQLAGIPKADVNAIVLDIEDGTFDQEDDIFYTNVPYDVLFYKDGNWNEEDNWTKHDLEVGLPFYNVYVVADATIPSGCEAEVYRLTVSEEASLTIADGGQLKHNNEGVTATVQKHINPYSGDGGYYLLTNPTLDEQDPEALGMTANNHDLYWFNQSEELEWRNYKQETFNLANGIGYLYANSESTDINFNGVLNPAGTDISVPLTYDANASFAGFNLVGNPFVCNAYLADGRDFYILDDVGAEVTLSTITNSIAPMQGVFVQAAADESELAFSTTEPTPGRALNMSLTRNDGSRGSSIIDNARIRFGDGRGMEKFQLNPSHSKLYIPQEGKDYAVVNVGRDAACHVYTIPVNFKAEENGTYTLGFSTEAVEFNYLHLVDNLTGADVDLLALRQAQGPAEYTFEAKTSDFASRFKLVFSTICGDADGDNDFAFIFNGNIIVNGEGTLQVIDMMGRVIASTDVARNVSTSGMTPGVYVLRLIYGDDVKTQKIIIK